MMIELPIAIKKSDIQCVSYVSQKDNRPLSQKSPNNVCRAAKLSEEVKMLFCVTSTTTRQSKCQAVIILQYHLTRRSLQMINKLPFNINWLQRINKPFINGVSPKFTLNRLRTSLVVTQVMCPLIKGCRISLSHARRNYLATPSALTDNAIFIPNYHWTVTKFNRTNTRSF